MKSDPNHPAAMVVVTVPITIKKRGGIKQILAPDGTEYAVNRKPDGALVKPLPGHSGGAKCSKTGAHATMADLAAAEKINPSYVSRIFRLTLLAPELVEDILNGRQPAALTLSTAMEVFSLNWQDQRAALCGQDVRLARISPR